MANPAPSASRLTRSRKAKQATKQPLQLLLPLPVPVRRLPRLERLERKGPILRASPMAESADQGIAGLNLLSGCPHRCPFCFARAYPNAPGDDRVYFYADTAQRLRTELEHRRKRPRAVYLCPSTDPFPPYHEVQSEAVRVVDVLAEYGIAAWIMTRGFIRPFAVDALERNRELVRVTVALMTLDPQFRRALEPLAAPPRLRLKQLAEFRERQIPVQAAVEPLIPGLTDTRENLEPLLDALAKAGVEHISTGYLYVRQGIRENLIRELGPLGWAEPILEPYVQGPTLPMTGIAPAKHLPRPYRQRGYAQLMALAAERGITVSVSGLTNPDFKPPRPPPPSPPAKVQMVLRYEE